MSDLQNALKQLKRRAAGQCQAMPPTPKEAQALLDERDALRGACEAIIREGDPYTATQDWPDPALFAGWAIEQVRAALAKTRNDEA